MASRSVDRCIAIAAHGRRCQQTTYRGSPYCWHHTQSRKVWAPSRMQASHGRQKAPALPPTVPPDALAAGAGIADALTRVAAAPAAVDMPPLDRIAQALTPEQLGALAAFLEAGGAEVFRIDRSGDTVLSARVDARLSRTLAARLAEDRATRI